MAYIEVCDRDIEHGKVTQEFTITTGRRSAKVVLCDKCARDMERLMASGQREGAPRPPRKRARTTAAYEEVALTMEEIEQLKREQSGSD